MIGASSWFQFIELAVPCQIYVFEHAAHSSVWYLTTLLLMYLSPLMNDYHSRSPTSSQSLAYTSENVAKIHLQLELFFCNETESDIYSKSGNFCENFIFANIIKRHMIQCMRFPTMWYVRPAKPQISLRMRAVWSEPLLVAWVFYDC